MIRRRYTYLLCGVLTAGIMVIGLGACSNRPSEVLSDEDAASLLADLHIADSYSSIEMQGDVIAQSELDSIHKVFRQSVMAAHGVSEAQLDTTLGWYGHNLDKYEDMYELVLKKIEEKQKQSVEAEAEKASTPTLWPYSNTMRLAAAKTDKYTLLPFDIASTGLSKGSRIVWEAKTLNSSAPLEVFMAVEYSDGSIGYVQRNVMGEGKQTVILQTDSSIATKRLYGYLRSRQASPLMLDSVRLTATPLNATSYYEIHSSKRWNAKK